MGLIEEWNDKNPDKDVRIGDKIVEVNGAVRESVIKSAARAASLHGGRASDRLDDVFFFSSWPR